MKLDRVVRLNEEEYLIQTIDEQYIKEIKEKYNGSEIFKGISVPIDFMEIGETERYCVHKVILSRAEVLEVDGLPSSI